MITNYNQGTKGAIALPEIVKQVQAELPDLVRYDRLAYVNKESGTPMLIKLNRSSDFFAYAAMVAGLDWKVGAKYVNRTELFRALEMFLENSRYEIRSAGYGAHVIETVGK